LWLTIGGLRIHARTTGAEKVGAPAIVLVHGVGVSSRYMVPTMSELADQARVYAPDLPGFGRSEGPRAALDIPGLADAVASWLAAAGIVRPTLVANSVGCQVVVDLVVRRPETATGLVLVGPTMDPHARSGVVQFIRLLRDAVREPPELDLLQTFDYAVAGPRRMLGTMRHSLRDRIEQKLPHVTLPTLVVRGANDPIVPQRWAEEAAALIPGGRLAVVPGARHVVNYTHPRELAALITALAAGRLPLGP
jgi:pimeloyl-ACP methyl ester carboxylesterase